jgi:hypothetical protein
LKITKPLFINFLNLYQNFKGVFKGLSFCTFIYGWSHFFCNWLKKSHDIFESPYLTIKKYQASPLIQNNLQKLCNLHYTNFVHFMQSVPKIPGVSIDKNSPKSMQSISHQFCAFHTKCPDLKKIIKNSRQTSTERPNHNSKWTEWWHCSSSWRNLQSIYTSRQSNGRTKANDWQNLCTDFKWLSRCWQ